MRLLPLLLFAACGGAPPQATLAATTATSLNLSATAVTHYGDDKADMPGGVAGALVKVGRYTRPKLKPSNKLMAIAESVLDAARPGAGVDPAVLRFAAGHHGLVEPITSHLVAEFTAGMDPEKVAQGLRTALHGTLRADDYNRMGVAVSAAQDGKQKVIILVSNRRVWLRPVPRAHPKGATLRLGGKLAPGFRKPAVYIAGPDGKVRQPRVSGSSEFSAKARCAGVGEHRLEVMAEADAGPVVLANFPVWCGTAPPAKFAVAAQAGGTVDGDEAAQRLFTLLNAERKKARLKPLRWHKTAARVALDHSKDMAGNDFVAHVSPTTGNVGDRVAAAGIDSRLTQENIGLGGSPESVHQGLMDSPGHRAAILSNRVSHVGVGVMVRTDAQGLPRFYATQVFVAPAAPFDAEKATTTIRKKVGRRAAKEKVPHDPALDGLAAALARQMAKGKLKAERVRAAAKTELERRKLPYRGVLVAASAGDDPTAVAKQKGLFRKNAAAFGVGVASGKANRVGLVVIGIE